MKKKVVLTNSGHYAVLLRKLKNLLENVQSKNAKVVLHVDALAGDKKMVQQLHSQFCHHPVKILLLFVKATCPAHKVN